LDHKLDYPDYRDHAANEAAGKSEEAEYERHGVRVARSDYP